MANIMPPKYVRQTLISLQSHGHQAYLVGGCVRDMLLGVRAQDWDLCTSALPEQVMEIFPGSRPTGLRHGTVTVKVNSRSLEVTTFRSDGGYTDHRHPDMVSFVGDLTTDLSRRDFTMNAIALPPAGLAIDPFGGAEDIENRLIRCVGDPERRFEEDALRMLRALRFSARLGFDIEGATLAAIKKCAPLAASLAAERVRDETEKILLTNSPQTAAELIGLGLLDRYVPRRPADAALFLRLSELPKKALERWCGFCAALDSCGCIDSVEALLLSLRLDSRTVRCCRDASQILRGAPPASDAEWKRCLRRCGVDAVSCAAVCGDALFGWSAAKALKGVLRSGECFSMKHLAVTGDDLLALGLRGRELGEMLNFLLDYVMEYPRNNRRELLLSLARGTEE
ncbi:MAG: hypothetical protein VB039_03770 [Oscillospiraceae bacterium]|nr:hypothetical protein [Oscillospiraceae bacterium]